MDAQSVIAIVCICFVLPVTILLLNDAFKRWSFARAVKKRRSRGPLILPYRIAYTSTVRDLLDAQSADNRLVLGMGPFLRFFYVLFGIFWACGPIWIYVFKTTRPTIGTFIIWLAGCAIVWRALIRPWMARHRIKRNNPPQENIELEFNDAGIVIHTSSAGDFHRSWNEASNAALCKKGLLVYFTDGICNLLPTRAFPAKDDMQKLHDLVHERILVSETKPEPEEMNSV